MDACRSSLEVPVIATRKLAVVGIFVTECPKMITNSEAHPVRRGQSSAMECQMGACSNHAFARVLILLGLDKEDHPRPLMNRFICNLCLMLSVTTASIHAQAIPGGRYKSRQSTAKPSAYPTPKTNPARGSIVRRWNEIAINATGLDHTPVAPGETRVFGEQLGPCRASRAMAMVHVAMFEAVNSARAAYQSYLTPARIRAVMHADAAVAQAAHDCLVALFPSQTTNLKSLLSEDLSRLPDGAMKINGINLGRSVAASMIARRTNDGSTHAEPRMGIEYLPGNAPGEWRQDPVSQHPLALGALWGGVTPFVLQSGDQFRLPPPPVLDCLEYSMAFVEVKRLGGDAITTPTERTEEETFIGQFWAYDGTPSLCAPPRLYNQIAIAIANRMHTPEAELARLLALVNLAMADSAIAAWDSKYHYKFWRPVTGIREADPGTGPQAAGDGNSDTVGDATFSPLGAPASNLSGPNFTPPFPAYPSGHATFGGALFQVLRRFYRTDNIAFTFVSDEFNGSTSDNQGVVRPLRPRSFKSLSEAEEENARSRIYLGIHWAFDASSGIELGRKVGNHVFDRTFLPRLDR